MEDDRDAYSDDATTVLDRRVISTSGGAVEGAIEIARLAGRELAIFSHELDGIVFGNAEFLEAVRQLAVSGPHARVRILVSQPTTGVRNAPQLLALTRQLSSHIAMRAVGLQHRNRKVTFIIADDRALIYHPVEDNADSLLEKIPGTARLYLNGFNEMWEHGSDHPDLRQLKL